MDISIVIVNYKSKGLTLNCLKSIREADWSSLEHEIIVVDNNSNDNIGQILSWQFPDVRFIKNEKNVGMGKGNNSGLKKARGRYVVIMNPDTQAMPETFRRLYEFMEKHRRVGAVGPRQYNPDKTVQHSCFRWHSLLTPVFRRTFLGGWQPGRKDLARFLMNDFDKQSVRQVDWLLGSFIFIRKEALKQAGMFDPRFFLYFEDTDLCRRLWRANWQVIYNPQAEIIHNHNRLSAKTPWYRFFTNSATRSHVVSWIKYLLKWGLKRPDYANEKAEY